MYMYIHVYTYSLHEIHTNIAIYRHAYRHTQTHICVCDIMPTYHYVQNPRKLMMQSLENGQKTQFGQFFDNFEAKYLENAIFSEK